MIAGSGRRQRPWAMDALRGALVGLAVTGTWYFAAQYADSVIKPRPGDDSLQVLGDTMLIVLAVGIPSSAVVGLLASWAVGLRRPWAVVYLGLVNTGLLVCGWGSLHFPTVEPRWVLPISTIVCAYATAAAVLAARFAQSSPYASQSTARIRE